MNGWSNTIELVSVVPGGKDADGFPLKPTEQKREVYCNVTDAKRTEFYQAMSNKVNVVYEVEMHLFEYEKEKLVDYDGNRYKVVRTYGDKKKETIILVLSENE